MTLCAPGFQRDVVWPQQILGRIVIAMLILDAFENRELALRPKVYLEAADTVDDVVVHSLGVAAVRLAAGLPVALENAPGIVSEGRELGRGVAGDGEDRQRNYSREAPRFPGRVAHKNPLAPLVPLVKWLIAE